MNKDDRPTILLAGNAVAYRLMPSRAARKLRIRVKPSGIEVVLPESRTPEEAMAFVTANQRWISEQLTRARRLATVRRAEKKTPGHVLFRGELHPVQVLQSKAWRAPNRVLVEGDKISIVCAANGLRSLGRSLENWLRKQARDQIERHMSRIATHIKRSPGRVYVMGQRTKWGNCSALGNLSFNWRLIMAPDYVLQYIVTHEMVHLAIPDHSQRFWLTVQSLCPQANKARQWLVANAHRLNVDLEELFLSK